VAGARYRVAELIGSGRGTNVYRAVDLEGYKRCWACGSAASVEGDTYCVECGAQLTERYYRLQEFSTPAESPGDGLGVAEFVPQPVLQNAVPGVAHVYDAFEDTETGRAYVVWEEVYGRTLASWLAGDTPQGTAIPTTVTTSGALPNIEEPGEEQALAWMTQVATLLADLHAQGITGCDLSLENLAVEPGDRVVMLTASGCRTDAADGASQLADVRVLASELERWYVQVRGEGDEQAAREDRYDTGMGGLTSSVDEVTGPLTSPSNPTTVLTDAKDGAFTTAGEFADALHALYEASRPVTGLYLWSGRASDVGRVRQINEDSLLTFEAMVIEHDEHLPVGLYVVADGMGGHQSGEVASAIAVRTIGSIVNSMLIGPLVAGDPVAHDPNTCANLMQQAVLEANRRITQLARERHSDLGTTVTAALVLGSDLTVANVGDSRTYVWRNGQLAVITRDHSFVAQLVAAGQIAPNEIYTHPRRNEIYRALGDPNLTANEVDTFSHHLLPGDGILLCSDGLWDFVRDPAIGATLADQDAEPGAMCRSLVDQANSAGGEDNITTIYVRVVARNE
jgi:protein phosphatase